MELPAHSFKGKKPKLEMAKEAYQDGHIKMGMVKKGKRDMVHKLASFCDSPSTCPFLNL
jgi:hypothetical protein